MCTVVRASGPLLWGATILEALLHRFGIISLSTVVLSILVNKKSYGLKKGEHIGMV